MLYPLAVLSLCLAVSTAPVSDPEALEKLAEAQEAFKGKDFAAAAAAIEATYLIEPAPALLYPWAQAEREQGNCEVAIELYQRFLDSGPDEEIAAAAQSNIDRCSEQLDDADVVVVDDDVAIEDDLEDDLAEDDLTEDELTEDELTEDPVEPEPKPEPAKVKDDEPKKWFLDPAGATLTGIGAVGVIAGGAIIGVASSKSKKVADEDTNSGYLDAMDGATKQRNTGVALLTIGSVLLVSGVIRYAVVKKKSKKTSASIWLGPRNVAGVTWSGRF